MDIVTIYGQPDEDNPLKAFEGLMKSFKKYGFRTCDRLIIYGPNFRGEKLEKIEKMLSLLSGEGHKFVPFSYRSGRNKRSLAEYHNYCMCVVSRKLRGEGKMLYIPFGCEPEEKNWGKTIETVMNMYPNKDFIGETSVGSNGDPYLSGACVLPYSFFKTTTATQAINAKSYLLDRANRVCRGGIESHKLPFTSIDLGGEVIETIFTVKGRQDKRINEAKELLPDVPDEVVDEVVDTVEEIIAPEPEPEPEVPDTFLEDELKSVAEQEVEKDEVKKDGFFNDKRIKTKTAKKAGKKKAAKKKRATKKTAKKKVAKKKVVEEAKTIGFNDPFPKAEKIERIDHTKEL